MRIATHPPSFGPAVVALLASLALLPRASAQDPVKLPRDPFVAAAKLEVNPSVDDGHPVLVVDAKGKPRGNVSVYIVDTRSLSRTRRRAINTAAAKKYPGDIESRQLALLALHGKRYVTDAAGELRFARVGRGIVVAVSGRTIVMTSVLLREGRDPRLLRLELKPKPGIDVLVVDHRGRPVRGVPIRLIWRSEWGSSSSGSDSLSGAGGRVRLSPLRRGSNGRTEIPYIEARIPAKKRVAVQLDPKTFVNDPEKPVRLQLPPCGSVRVYVVDQNKRPVKGIDSVILKTVSSFDNRFESFSAPDVKDDYATFPFVEVGFVFEATCVFKGQSRPQKIRDDGPRHPSDMRVVTIEGVKAPTVVSFRLLDQQGAPVARETVGVIFVNEKGFTGRIVTTAADGRLEVTLDDQFAAAEEGSFFVTRRGNGGTTQYRGAVRLALESLAKSAPDRELRLKDEDLLVSGRVVDTAGKPVVGEFLTLSSRYGGNRSGGSSTSGDSKFFGHELQTDKEGRFAFRELDADPLAIMIKLSGYGSRGSKNYFIVDGAEPDSGAKDHKVVVGLTSRLTGSFQGLGKGKRFGGQIEILDADGAPLGNDRRLHARVQPGGKFEVPRCPPGEYCLNFKLSGQSEPFLTVKGIKAVSGKPSEDPRLQNIDLTKYCRNLRVTVLGPDQKPVRNTTVWTIVATKGRRSASGNSTGSKGTVDLTVPIEGSHLSIVPRGGEFRAQHFAMQKEDLTVNLKPGWHVKFDIKNMPKLPDNLRMRVHPEGANGPKKPDWAMDQNSTTSLRYLTDNHRHDMWFASSGSMRIKLYPAYANDSNHWLNQRRAFIELKIEIKEKADGIQEFDLKLDELGVATIEEFIEEAKERSKKKD